MCHIAATDKTYIHTYTLCTLTSSTTVEHKGLDERCGKLLGSKGTLHVSTE